jgi:hypothetical protein
MKFRFSLIATLFSLAMLVTEFSASAEANPLPHQDADCSFLGSIRGVKHYNLGVDLQAKGDFEGAIAEYRISIRECSTFWRAAYNIAR